jgi:hypothetical protein
MALIYVANALIVAFTALCLCACFRKEGKWSLQAGLRTLRFFTTLSNVLCAVASLLVLLTLRQGVPFGVWLLKYIGTAAVCVTFMTVMVFLGPTIGYRDQLKGFAFYLHVSGPLIAAISFCFLERWYPLSFALSLTGMLPVVLYGALYLNRVVVAKKWDDFYGFNKSGKWQISFSAMVAGSFLLCLLLWFLYRL